MTNQELGVAGIKLGSVWGMVAVTSWKDAAAMVAFIYTVLLIGEFVWKKLLKPFGEKKGWFKSDR